MGMYVDQACADVAEPCCKI